MQFDLTSIPTENVEIIEATLSLNGSPNGTFANGVKDAKPILVEWDATTATWGHPWLSNGGSATNSNKGTCTNTQFNTWDNYDVTAAIYERHLKGSMYGFLIEFAGDNKGIAYHSSESDAQELRPKLSVRYRILEQKAPVVNIISPNAGSELIPHSETTFEWIASDNSGVEYQKLWLKKGSENATLLDSLAGDVRTYTWNTPCVGDSLRVILQAWDEAGNSAIDTSDYFGITPDTATHKGSEAMMVSADWYGAADNMGSSCDFHKGDSVWCTMKLAKKSGSEYPWVNLSSELHESQKLTGTAFIKVTYKSDKSVKMSLVDPVLSSNGVAFSSLLPRSTKKRDIYLHVNSCHFTQPDWTSDKATLDLEKVIGLSFEPNIDPTFGGSIELEIYDVVLYGYSGTIATLSGGGTLAGEVTVTQVGKALTFNSGVRGMHEVTLYQLNGAVVNHSVVDASGRFSLSLEGMSLAQKPYIVEVKTSELLLRKLLIVQ